MLSTPNSNRKHIGIYGKVNSGKSSLINELVQQHISSVSPFSGTTTDVVYKAMELIPVGPVLFIDTPGIGDLTELGETRIKNTYKTLSRVDTALYVMDSIDIDHDLYNEMKLNFKRFNIPFLTVVNKIDLVDNAKQDLLKAEFDDAVFISVKNKIGIDDVRNKIVDFLKQENEEGPIVGDILPYNSKVILVVPIDSEAPKGRIILPQVQCIRDCLDHGIKSYVVRDTELEGALNDIKEVDLVITDSQAFKKVGDIVPLDVMLTSFSILFARHKGDLNIFLEGIRKIESLNKRSKILVLESCSHNISHEDIGRFKIPNLLNKRVGFDLEYDFYIRHDVPEDIKKYDLVIHCGACMINRKTVLNRIERCKYENVSITNYGILLAYLTGNLERSIAIFKNNIHDKSSQML